MFRRIVVKNPIAELDGDEMARVVWHWIKERLVLPFVDVPILYHDLGLKNRNDTNDIVTVEAANDILKCNVGIKCATITPDLARLHEFGLNRLFRSPNATLREALNGTVFREPILLSKVPRLIPTWKSPIIIGRHAFGDIYSATEMRINSPGKVELVFTPARENNSAAPTEKLLVHNFKSKGVALGMFNLTKNIEQFAHACFQIAITRKLPLYLSTKNTILKEHDGLYYDIFSNLYSTTYKQKFEACSLAYEHRLIDDMVAFALKSNGGFIWACKNYDGDVQSDVVAQGFGSLGLMKSVLISSDGKTIETEAAHGTVTRHFREHLAGRKTSTNPIASIYAWSTGLSHRAELDSNILLQKYCKALESACVSVVDEDGIMTRDLANLQENKKTIKAATTEEFLKAVEDKLNFILLSSKD